MVDKIKGTENVADIGTKPLPGPTFVKLRAMLGLMMMKGTNGADVDYTMNDEEQNDNSRFWYMVLIVLMMLLVMSCAFGYHLGY